ncbi:hypothetical protein SLS55_007216 [Diplodia seriata]|uniref:Uncharacterized protein n=1 Tax=Diplodia seriata TaxID=420778 RepID=A0ABR3CCY7_9PEZI
MSRPDWNVMPCPSNKYCCSFGKASNACCANEEDTFEVSWGAVPDHTTSIYSTWTYTTMQTATETDCPAALTTLASTTPAGQVARPTVKARFTA